MFKILNEVCTPQRATKYSAYVDLFARESTIIGAGETKIVPLGVQLDVEGLKKSWIKKSGLANTPEDPQSHLIEFGFNHFLKSHYLELAIRSSLATRGLIIANGSGKIDLDYPHELGLIAHYPYNGKGASHCQIHKGDKIAQCTLIEHKGYLMGLDSGVERTGGFGSTGQ